jgi:RNA polymerase sigma factor (sigma-70 family)
LKAEDSASATQSDRNALDRADMERLASGHDAALNELMARHGEKLFNFLVRALENQEDAADLAQETFVRVYQHRRRFDPRQKFTTWLYSIGSNLVKDRYRWRSRHPAVALDAEPDGRETSLLDALMDNKPSPTDTAMQVERGEAVRRAVSGLPEELRLPLILAEYEERSHLEIGEILGCSAKAVETRIYRARQHLRKELAGLLNG